MIINSVIIFTIFVVSNALSGTVDLIQGSIKSSENVTSGFDEAPWLVSIRIHGVHYCSGAIISSERVITSAQCIFNEAKMKEMVTIQTRPSDFHNGNLYKVYSSFNHGSYNLINCILPNNDIGMIQISGSFDFTGPHAPNLIKVNNTIDKLHAELNVTDYVQNLDADNKITVTAKTSSWISLKKRDCLQYYSHMNELLNTGNLFCAVKKDDNFENPCVMGDLGSPIVSNGKLVGIKSQRLDCEIFSHTPSLFTDVGYYTDWIRIYCSVNVL